MVSREMTGEAFRGWVRNAIPLKSTELSNTLRWLGTSAPPKVGLKKSFWAMVQVTSSRAGPLWSSQMVVSAASLFVISAGAVSAGRYFGGSKHSAVDFDFLT